MRIVILPALVALGLRVQAPVQDLSLDLRNLRKLKKKSQRRKQRLKKRSRKRVQCN